MDLRISVLAGVHYKIGWEIALAATHHDTFADSYGPARIHAAQARGASAAEVAKITESMQDFKVQYANPRCRMPMTLIEVIPVGVVISLIAAGLLRNSHFLPGRPALE